MQHLEIHIDEFQILVLHKIVCINQVKSINASLDYKIGETLVKSSYFLSAYP